MPRAESVKRGELGREQPGHPVGDPLLDVVHLRPGPEGGPVVLDRPPGELRERRRHVRAEVCLALVPGHDDARTSDVDAVGYAVEGACDFGRLARQAGELRRRGVSGEVVAERYQAARGEFRPAEGVGERAYRRAVAAGRAQEPGLLLVAVTELARLGQPVPHGPHPLREPGDGPGRVLLFQVPEHLMPVLDRVRVAQRRPEKRGQVVLLPAGGHARAYPVKVKVPEERRLRPLGGRDRRAGQNADNRHGSHTSTSTESLTR